MPQTTRPGHQFLPPRSDQRPESGDHISYTILTGIDSAPPVEQMLLPRLSRLSASYRAVGGGKHTSVNCPLRVSESACRMEFSAMSFAGIGALGVCCGLPAQADAFFSDRRGVICGLWGHPAARICSVHVSRTVSCRLLSGALSVGGFPVFDLV